MRYLITVILLFNLSKYSLSQFDESVCGKTLGCHQSPPGCSPASVSCKFVSWTYDDKTNQYTIGMSGPASNAQWYFAVAFTQMSTMANADTYICTSLPMLADQFKTSTIVRKSEPTDDATLQTGIQLVTHVFTSGKVQCVFKRPSAVTKIDQIFDLSTKQYYLLLASGPTNSDGNSVTDFHTFHEVSHATYNFTQARIGKAASKSSLVKAHGVMMIIAWMFLVNVGGVIARHFKPTWPHTHIAGKDIWFQFHRGCMLLAVAFTVLAFILIFVSVGGFVQAKSAFNHAAIGIVITILSLFNPVMAAFRPHPGTSNRFIFNWAHWGVGSIARVLAIANLFIGVQLTQIGLPKFTTWTLVAFVVFHIVCEIIFELITWSGKSETRSNFGLQNEAVDERPAKAPEKHARAKTFLLIGYIIVTFSLACVLFSAIRSV